MTTYTYPTSGRAFALAGQTWTQRHNTRVSTSSLNGAIQTTSLPGMRWGMTLDFPQQTYAERAELMGFLSRLAGQTHRLAMWDQARPTPGNLAGSPLINGAVAQFANTLSIDGAIRAGNNLLTASQDFDNAAWSKAGATIGANVTSAPDGTTTADKLGEDATTGLHRVFQAFGSTNGTTYTFSACVRSAERTACLIAFGGSALTGVGGSGADRSIIFDLAAGVFTATASQYSPSAISLGGGWWRLAITATTDADGGSIIPYVAPVVGGASSYAGTAGSGICVWGAQLEVGSVATTYAGPPSAMPGDWLSLPLSAGGSQLVQVVSGVAGETLAGIEFAPMLRGAVADNAAVGITRPTALFVLANPELSIPRGGSNICPPFSVELIEVFS